MDLRDKRILITGASSGIGRCIALELARTGATLALAGRNEKNLEQAAEEIAAAGADVRIFPSDLTQAGAAGSLWSRVVGAIGIPDVLINNAGVLDFAPVELERPEDIEALFGTNVVAPILLCREAITSFGQRGSGHIVNVGSIFGSIGFAYFASYSASKFALRGYSEALRRELEGTGIQVTYVAPRATKTRLADLFGRMADEVGMKMDEPDWVAKHVVAALRANAKDKYLGFPESLFVRLNGLFPRLVDGALREQNRQTRPFAEEAAVERASS